MVEGSLNKLDDNKLRLNVCYEFKSKITTIIIVIPFMRNRVMENSKREKLVNKVKSDSKSIALIYSPIELHEYIVEIIAKDSDEFIHKGKELWHFHSIDEAMSRAAEYGAEEFFLCADNTYDECGTNIGSQTFDYIPLYSKA